MEIWKDIEGYEGIYQVSDEGNVRSLDRITKYKNTIHKMKLSGKPIKGNTNTRGYRYVNLCKNSNKKTITVHRLVMKHFIPNHENKSEINHIDGNKTNNKLSNLEWVTSKENYDHSVSIGLRKNRYKGNNPKLNENEVKAIREMYDSGNYTQKEIAEKYDVNRNTIGDLLSRKSWSWV